jgi:hypothetical protein
MMSYICKFLLARKEIFSFFSYEFCKVLPFLRKKNFYYNSLLLQFFFFSFTILFFSLKQVFLFILKQKIFLQLQNFALKICTLKFKNKTRHTQRDTSQYVPCTKMRTQDKTND